MTEELRKGELMAVGIIHTEYSKSIYSYSATTKTDQVFEGETLHLEEKLVDTEEILGIGFLTAGNRHSYGMSARYAESSTNENPIIKVCVTIAEGDIETYEININEVNPCNATEIEMFALCSYADATGNGTGGSFGSWQTLNYYRHNAIHREEFEVSNSVAEFTTLKQNWSSMVGSMITVYMEAGIYKQAMDGQKLLSIFEQYSGDIYTESNKTNVETADYMNSESFVPDATAEENQDYERFFQEKIQEIFVKLENGDTEASYQIGSQTYTEEEWNRFLKNFDSIEEAIRELMREAQEKIEEEQLQQKQDLTKDETDLLVAESTTCTYPTANPLDNDIQYITWYTEDGIFCRKAGRTEGYEWSIAFTDKEQYSKVKDFIGQFSSDWNMRFAAHENFWNDFLNEEIDMDGFMEFLEGTNKGVPDYSVTVGDSMYIDKEKIIWAEYFNPLGSRFYTAEEMNKLQMHIMAENISKHTKITASYEDIYRLNHPEYSGERIFCEYPGGPLYTANEISSLMYEKFLATNDYNIEAWRTANGYPDTEMTDNI